MSRSLLAALLALAVLPADILGRPWPAAPGAVLGPLPASLAGLAAAPVSPVALPTAPGDDTIVEQRAAILAIARAYAEHEWTAGPDNVLHGPADDGVHVDTPDASHRPDGWHADGRTNVGVPYKWGGFSSLEQFDAGVAAGRPAGELTDGVDLDASALSVGVDCSGFVARCWELPVKQSTRSLGRLCFELDSFDELLPGDLINKFDAHAQIFVGFADEARSQVTVIEAAFPCVKRNTYPAAALRDAGFRPYRYKPLDPRWVAVEPDPNRTLVDWTEVGDGAFVADPDAPLCVVGTAAPAGEVADPTELASVLDELGDPLADAAPGAWCRYLLSNPGRDGGMDITRVLAARDGDGFTLQASSSLGDAALRTQERMPAAGDLATRLLGLEEQGQAFDRLDVLGLTVTPGHWQAADGIRWPARQVELRCAAEMTMRTNVVPVDLTVSAVLSDAIPMEGVIELRRDSTWHLPSGAVDDATVRRLLAAGR